LLRKNGRASLVDFKVFDEILDTLPPISGAKATTAPSDTA
jgi:hypothetical protein